GVSGTGRSLRPEPGRTHADINARSPRLRIAGEPVASHLSRTNTEVAMLTREDRTAIDGLFERLREAERRGGPRDAEAEAYIRSKIAAHPAAPYYLAQT